MISKELLSAVLNNNISCSIMENSKSTALKYFEVVDNNGKKENKHHYINIYELQHLLKEWAWNNGYRIKSQLLFQYFHIDVSKYSSDFVENVVFFKEMTEPEAIFKACEWILKELQDA